MTSSCRVRSPWLPILSLWVLCAPLAAWGIERTTLSPADPEAGGNFGGSVAVDGDTALVGSAVGSTLGADAGAAYVFVRSGNTWMQQAKLTAADVTPDDRFRFSVALSGDTALVGAQLASPADLSSAGAAYVFVRSGTTWTQQAKLTASDMAADALFGSAVAISGDTAVIGAYSAAQGGLSGAGAAYVFVRSGNTWTQQAKLTASDIAGDALFGIAAAAAGDTVLIGASGALSSDAGSAYVFVRSGTTWTQQAKLTAGDTVGRDEFGFSVSLAGDTAVIGAASASPMGMSHAGAAYVFVRSGSIWTQQAKLTAQPLVAESNFGAAVAFAGNLALVGATSFGFPAQVGAAYTFVRIDTTWTQQDILTDLNLGMSDGFGYSVSLTGNTAVVGAYATSPAGLSAAGSAYVLEIGQGDGAACTLARDCHSGYCVDGVCCYSECAGGPTDCQACSRAAGGASDGVCSRLSAGTMCAGAQDSLCVAGGRCDGVSTACQLQAADSTVVCGHTADASGCPLAYRCDGTTAGSCPATNPTGSQDAPMSMCSAMKVDDGMSATSGCQCQTGRPADPPAGVWLAALAIGFLLYRRTRGGSWQTRRHGQP